MMSFRGDKLAGQSYGGSTTWPLSALGEHKGRQELFVRQSLQVLKTLREHAMIQSTESSNRIEGVTMAPDRLAPLVLGKAKPRDRSEEEILGYRRGSDWSVHRGIHLFRIAARLSGGQCRYDPSCHAGNEGERTVAIRGSRPGGARWRNKGNIRTRLLTP